MTELNTILVDGVSVTPVSVLAYQELLRVEVLNSELTNTFPYKPETPRYQINANDTPMGHYKVLSVKALANQETSLLTLHRQ